MTKVTLVLDDNDVGQIVDGLTERLADWRYTARYFEDGLVDPERSFLECTDAHEANAIADHYEKIIAQIRTQLAAQRKKPRLKYCPHRPNGPKDQ